MADFEVTGDEGRPDLDAESEKEKQLIRRLLKAYNSARTFDKDARKEYAKDRKYASGKADLTWAVDANYIGTFIDILISFLYGQDPDVLAQPTEKVGTTPDENDEMFADTLQLVIRLLWKNARLKKYFRKMLRSSLSVGPGWLKVIMVVEKRNNPLIENKLNDARDNMARLVAKRETIKNKEGDKDEEEINVLIKESELLMASLSDKLEVVFRRGLAIDFVRAEDMQVSLDVSEISDHLSANWNANQMFIQSDEAPMMFPRLTAEDLKTAKVFYQRKDKKDSSAANVTAEDAEKYTAATQTGGGAEDEVKFIRVVELWDKRDNHIKTMIDGVNKWARLPYQPPHASTRFYPYFELALFETDSERHPQSLTGRLIKLQEEYSSARSNGRLARERSVPGIIFDAQKITPDDIKKIERSVHQEYVGVNPIGGDDIRKAFAEKPVGKYDPRIYDTSASVKDMEVIAGVQEALSQGISRTKTATEANIEQTGFASRTGADRDTEEDVLTDLARYTAELSLQALPYEYVVKIAGKLAFWPENMPFEEVVTMVNVEIEGGTTGKPNKDAERQSWATVMPLIRETIIVIQQAFAAGNVPLAEALSELLRETLQRMDDRVNLDRFLPTLAATPEGAVPAEQAGGAVTPSPGAAAPAGAPVQ
jgi:hypothetical protein